MEASERKISRLAGWRVPSLPVTALIEERRGAAVP